MLLAEGAGAMPGISDSEKILGEEVVVSMRDRQFLNVCEVLQTVD